MEITTGMLLEKTHLQNISHFQCQRITRYDVAVSHFRKYTKSTFTQATNQSEDLEKVQISIEDVLYLLQPLLAESTHGVADPMEAHATGEDYEALQQGLTACNVFQLQVWDTKCKLETMEEKGKGAI